MEYDGMSICRFGNHSDVYAFYSINNKIVCCGCRINNGDQWDCEEDHEMEQHLQDHIAAGHRVPEYALERVAEEIEEEKSYEKDTN